MSYFITGYQKNEHKLLPRLLNQKILLLFLHFLLCFIGFQLIFFVLSFRYNFRKNDRLKLKFEQRLQVWNIFRGVE